MSGAPSGQYRSILKATSIFGGTQLLQILITFLRSKFVALLIGAEGMGLSAMYSSTITLFITICSLGIETSVVKDLSKAFDEGDETSIAIITGVFRRVLSFLSIIGAILVIALAKPLSIWTFKTADYQYDMMVLSLMLVFSLLQRGNMSLLIGTRKIKHIALCSLLGSVAVLLTSIPLFYFWGTKGIVPGFVLSSFANYLISYIYCRKIKLVEVDVTMDDIMKYGKTIIVLGVAMVASVLLGNLTRYLTNIVISNIGSIEDIGFYNAAISITIQSISLVFAAMSSDYFPRLAAAMKEKKLMNETVWQQTEVIIYMVIPILMLMMIASPLIIKILLTDEFLVINQFVRVVTIGVFFKAISFPLGYLAFAKGDKNIYLWLEGVYSNFSSLLFSIVFYYIWGLKGMAWAMVITNVLYYIIVSIVGVNRYNLVIQKRVLMFITVAVIAFLIMYLLSIAVGSVSYIIVASIMFMSFSVFCLKNLNERTQFMALIKNKLCSHDQ